MKQSGAIMLSPSPQRSRNMSAVRGKNTKPEIIVRRLLHSLGYRYRLHRRDLPGRPDIVLPKFRTCIFVHGCFWHQHPNCKRATIPKTNRSFWLKKFHQNQARDAEAEKALCDQGWRVLVVWECEIKNKEALALWLRHSLSR